MIRVLIVDDSVTQREILRRLLDAEPEFLVIGEARNAREAIKMVRIKQPDVVLMDVHMPGMDGIETTRIIMAENPVPIVIASATLHLRDVDWALAALEAGAVSVMRKPPGAALLHLAKIGPELRTELIAAAKVKRDWPVRPAVASPTKPTTALPRVPASSTIDVVGICVSTGGPTLLQAIFSALPRPFPLPVLLVQHISAGFDQGFARWLTTVSKQPAALAVDRQPLEPGIWVAPSNHHLTLNRSSRLSLMPRRDGDIHCPSGNFLFESLATTLPDRSLGILLTGMGDDGASGLLHLKAAGGTTIVQDEQSSLIWGMPKAALDLGAAMFTLSPTEIAAFLTNIAPKVETPL